MFFTSIFSVIKSRSLWHYFHAPVILPYTFTDDAIQMGETYTVDSRYLEVQGTLWNTSRYPYLDLPDLQNWGKNKPNNHISKMNM